MAGLCDAQSKHKEQTTAEKIGDGNIQILGENLKSE